MSQKANRALIGGFVVSAIALAVISILIFGSGKLFKVTDSFVLYFEGSVKGLNIGAPVVFRGVKVGRVTDIAIVTEAKEVKKDISFRIPVVIELEEDRFRGIKEVRDPENLILVLIKWQGLRAQLDMASLVTGQLMVNLDFFPDTEIKLTGIYHKYPEIPTIPTPLQEMLAKIQKIPIEELALKLTSAISGIERTINSVELTDSLKTVDETLKDIQALVRNVDSKIDPLVSGITETVGDYGKLARNLDAKVTPLASNAGKLVRDVNRQIKPILSKLNGVLTALTAASNQTEKTLQALESLVSVDSVVTTELTNALRELKTAARSIRFWADYLERHPDALIFGKKGSRSR